MDGEREAGPEPESAACGRWCTSACWARDGWAAHHRASGPGRVPGRGVRPRRGQTARGRDAGRALYRDGGDIAGECTVVLVCVGHEEQVAGLVSGDAALVARMKPGSVVAVLSTISRNG